MVVAHVCLCFALAHPDSGEATRHTATVQQLVEALANFRRPPTISVSISKCQYRMHGEVGAQGEADLIGEGDRLGEIVGLGQREAICSTYPVLLTPAVPSGWARRRETVGYPPPPTL